MLSELCWFINYFTRILTNCTTNNNHCRMTNIIIISYARALFVLFRTDWKVREVGRGVSSGHRGHRHSPRERNRGDCQVKSKSVFHTVYCSWEREVVRVVFVAFVGWVFVARVFFRGAGFVCHPQVLLLLTLTLRIVRC